MKNIIVLVIILAIVGFGYYTYQQNKQASLPKKAPQKQANPDVYDGVGYAAINPNEYEISVLSDRLIAPTRIKLTPDGKFLLVSQITGEVYAFSRTDFGWDTTPYEVAKVDTKFPGFPPDEAGLVGMVFSNRFSENNKLFLLYTFKDQDGKTQNRISETVLRIDKGQFRGSTPKLIYQANVAGSGSHQITDGVSIDILGKPHLLFLIGEGFHGDRAQNPKEEGGKAILIQEDGSDPLGERPYKENPKVQALGIRNGYVLASNPYDKTGRIFISDTGPDHFDRIIYTKLFDSEGKSISPLNFNWDGTEEKLKDPIPDPNNPDVPDMVILRLPDTLTVTGLAVHPSKDTIPKSDEKVQSVLTTLFGKTGSPQNQPGKEIWIGQLTNLGKQPKISFTPIIKRNPQAEGKLGNPIGLEIDSQTGDFYFADVLEGKLYLVKVK